MNYMSDPKKDNWFYRFYGGDFIWGHFKYAVLKKVFFWLFIFGIGFRILISPYGQSEEFLFLAVYLTAVLVYIVALFFSKRLATYILVEGSTAKDAKYTLTWLGSTATIGLLISLYQLNN
jgi:hypothetical protein